jgi:16S rRNA (uracil1498-N3)-methyltransferase
MASRRRVHVESVHAGVTEIPEREAHHLRDVLRLKVGEVVELFDDGGNVAEGEIIRCDSRSVAVAVAEVAPASGASARPQIIVAASVPKGDRADWMIEKLSELGVSRFTPLATERGVVLPEGKNKLQRWQRIAAEAAKQSRRAGVMRIDPLTKLEHALDALAPPPSLRGGGVHVVILSTAPRATPIVDALRDVSGAAPLALFIGPEGGWTDQELRRFSERNLTHAKLTETILRVETAAVTAAAVVACWRASLSASAAS